MGREDRLKRAADAARRDAVAEFRRRYPRLSWAIMWTAHATSYLSSDTQLLTRVERVALWALLGLVFAGLFA